MPKATKEVKIDNEKKIKTQSKKSTTATKKSTVTKSAPKKTTTKSKTTVTKSSTTTKKAASTSKKSTTKKSTTTKKKTTNSSTTKKKSTSSKIKKLEANVVAEYYDLPYRYNETVVKILYQTPTILFVYWDISDSDREKYIKEYGQNFFYNTKPVLKIFNLTKNYSFEVEINDFANSWYINVNDANCEYKVELGRKVVTYEETLNNDYIHISTSNDIEFPNDHILLDELPDIIKFKNVKTNSTSTKDISTLHLVGINKIYSVYDFYKKFYKDEIFEEVNSNKVIIPSSSSWN